MNNVIEHEDVLNDSRTAEVKSSWIWVLSDFFGIAEGNEIYAAYCFACNHSNTELLFDEDALTAFHFESPSFVKSIIVEIIQIVALMTNEQRSEYIEKVSNIMVHMQDDDESMDAYSEDEDDGMEDDDDEDDEDFEDDEEDLEDEEEDLHGGEKS